MNTSFYNGLVGMKTSQFGIDVWGDNIANANTTGYKQQNVDFSTLFSTSISSFNQGVVSSDIGVGATPTTTTMDLSQGSIISTDNVFDLALMGDGWMAISDYNNQIKYTRTGAFTRDFNGTLVNDSGNKLMVVNANNLKEENGKWKFDSSIDTTNLITPSTSPNSLSSINLPDNIIFPAVATQNVKIAGNLPNTPIANDTKPAIENNDMGVLYDSNNKNINLKENQDLIFGFGDNITYDNGLIKYTTCIDDDTVDGEDVNIDFSINGVNIQTTLPDGSTAKEIIDAISKKIDEYNQENPDNQILYKKTDTYIQFKDPNKLTIKNNGYGFNNASMSKLIYKTDPKNPNEFNTTTDFINQLQTLADNVYTNVNVGLDENGKFYIQNNNDGFDIVANSYSTDNSNKDFMLNLGHLANVIKPNTASSSLKFKQNYQGFSGNIIDENGDVNDLKFNFTKTKIDNTNTIWTLELQEIKDGEVINSQTQDLTFNSEGALISPTTITFNASTPINIDLGGGWLGITSSDKDNIGFSYSQDGLVNGYLENYDVNEQGQILANFSNGKTGVLGQIPIYHFQNEQGLDSLGANLFTETDNSNKAFLYADLEGNYLSGAKIKNYSLESSNVNMSQAMTELIIIQKAYDANSKSITTSDQFIQKAIDMKK
jgi:flagellar hook protein FlgE